MRTVTVLIRRSSFRSGRPTSWHTPFSSMSQKVLAP